MDYLELRVAVPAGRLDEAAAVAQLAAPGGIYIEDYSDLEQSVLAIARTDLIDEALRQKDRKIAVIHLYLPAGQPAQPAADFLRERLIACGIEFSLTDAPVSQEDWANSWKQYYRPIVLSDRLAVCPSWESLPQRAGQRVIRLDPGMAFGTGTHETTRLCLSLIEAYLTEGARVLDVGCGSGILAIAARLLGAGSAAGVDIDATAVRTARENAQRNSCGEIEFFVGDLAGGFDGTFDLICANITADAIVRLACDLPARMAADGVCILSGILAERRDEVALCLSLSGLVAVESRTENGWAALVCRRAV